ncbi:MAG: tetratricopeptide repeat protein [bacterium]|nr:tetratricopeptide repeat protein [bacterium]
MSELRHLLEYRGDNIFTAMGACPSVCAAYKLLLDGDHEGAEQRFRRILKDNPEDHEALAGLAVCVAEDGGKFLTAEKLAKKATNMDRKSAAGYIALGYINLRGGRLQDGYGYLMKAKHLAPKDPRLQAGFAIYDRERPPVITGLSRLHPVNRTLNGVRNLRRNPAAMALAVVGTLGCLYLATNLVA